MAINFVIPVNIVFEIAMLAVQAYAYHYNKTLLYARIDQVYLGVVAVALLGSFIWLGYLNGKTKRFTSTVRSLRYIEAGALIVTGSLMIYSAQDIQSDRLCNFLEEYMGECQKYVPKLAAGILAIVNGLIYFVRPCKTPAAPLAGFRTNTNVQQYPQQPSYAAQPNEQSPVYGFQPQYYAAQSVPGTAPYPQTHGYLHPPRYENDTTEYIGMGYNNGDPNAATQQQRSNYEQPPPYYTNRAFQ